MKHLIFQTISDFGRYQCQKKLHIASNEVTYTKIQIAAVREKVNRDCSSAFCWEKSELNSGVCSHLFSYCCCDKQTHPDSDLKYEGRFC
jgi:hypothetical protein